MPRVAAIEPTDEELLARVADGDRDAFGDLYQRYARAGARARAAPARRPRPRRGRGAGGVRVDLAGGAQLPAERGPVAPWLYAVARNAIADRGRARVEPPAEPADTPSDEPGPPEQAEQSWVAWRVHRAMEDAARRPSASVLELAYWSGLSQSEIAELLGIPLGTVKTRTRSGLRRLADELGGELE